jgi:hypothetical protein
MTLKRLFKGARRDKRTVSRLLASLHRIFVNKGLAAFLPDVPD